MKPRLCLSGASGFLGLNICKVAQNRFDIIALYNNYKPSLAGINFVHCDITDENSIKQIFTKYSPDAFIHAGAISAPNICEQDPQKSFLVNVQGSILCAKACAYKNIPFVFTSTDLVFDGTQPPYSEESKCNPINVYGKHKLQAEQEIHAIYPNASVCRMPLMYGDTDGHANSFIQPIIKAFKTKQEITLFQDEIRTPASALTASEGLLLAIEKKPKLIHLGGIERMSRVEFGKRLAAVLKISDGKIIEGKQRDVTMSAPRPKDVSLDSSKAFALGYKPLKFEDELHKLQIVKEF